MTDLHKVQLDDYPIQFPHEFEVDLNNLVSVNRDFTLEAINRSEDKEIAEIQNSFAPEQDELMLSETGHVAAFYEDLRRAANNLAMVALVTRLQHWIGRFVKRLPGEPVLPKPDKSALVTQLELLNTHLGNGPVPIRFFSDLVTVRDSVIHGDSREKWEFPSGKWRSVPKVYVNCYNDVEVTEEQFKEAVSNGIQQVKWYDERLHEKKKQHSES